MRLQGVSCAFGGRAVLCDTTLELSERRIGVVGRNGSGKSTLARLIAGLIAPDSGRVLVNGVDVYRQRRAAVGVVGILFQNPDRQIIFPTVEEELAFGLTQLGQSKSEARAGAQAMLARFGRPDWAPRAVATLSQGQRHLVCLMAVLAMRPAVILLDEPFSGLDIPTTRALRRYLAEIEPAIIQITHDPSALEGYDRVLWIDAGRIRADGAPGPVLDAFLAAMNAEESGDAGTDLAG
ncbi:ABC transporter ATP-binding protein [Actibacterium sp. MT2.3-13A]|uniref:energy-coupling factor ABC transporter ATP-binding protein n=1 Tax=Actibacterium sp. MT2.3-13A TaxID=2828332 RepID=UPI0032C24777